MKNLFLLLLLVGSLTTKGATNFMALVSSNAFTLGTNGIYAQSLANDVTLSNAISARAYISSPASTLQVTNFTSGGLYFLNSPNNYITNGASGYIVVQSHVLISSNAVISGSLSVGGGPVYTHILGNSATLDFPSTQTNQVSTLPITVSRAGTNSTVSYNIVSPDTNFIYNAVVSATNTVTIRAANIGLVAVDPAPTSVIVTVFQVQ